MTLDVRGLEHVGIVVRDIDAALARYERLGFTKVSEEDLHDQGLRSHIIRAADLHLELLEVLDEDSTTARFLERHGPGMHHLCLRVDSLADVLDDTDLDGFERTSDQPTVDGEGTRIFLHPETTGGVLIGIVEPHKERS